MSFCWQEGCRIEMEKNLCLISLVKKNIIVNLVIRKPSKTCYIMHHCHHKTWPYWAPLTNMSLKTHTKHKHRREERLPSRLPSTVIVITPHLLEAGSRERRFVARATCSPFFEKIKNDTLKFQKNLKQILDVDNDDIHQCAKYQCEIFCILRCIKMKNF